MATAQRQLARNYRRQSLLLLCFATLASQHIAVLVVDRRIAVVHMTAGVDWVDPARGTHSVVEHKVLAVAAAGKAPVVAAGKAPVAVAVVALSRCVVVVYTAAVVDSDPVVAVD